MFALQIGTGEDMACYVLDRYLLEQQLNRPVAWRRFRD